MTDEREDMMLEHAVAEFGEKAVVALSNWHDNLERVNEAGVTNAEMSEASRNLRYLAMDIAKFRSLKRAVTEVLEPEPPTETDQPTPDYTEIRDDRIRGVICKHMSEMLDNPGPYAIYPTSKFMWEMETFILDELKKDKKRIAKLEEERDD